MAQNELSAVVQAEQAALGAMLLDGSAFDRVAGDLAELDFSQANHQLIYRCIGMAAGNGSPIDLVTVHEIAERQGLSAGCGGMPYLANLLAMASSIDAVDYYAEIIRSASTERKLEQVGGQISALATKRDEPLSERINRAATAVTDLAATSQRFQPTTIGAMFTAHIDVLDQRVAGKAIVHSTGFNDLDDHLDGGLRPGELIIVAGRPSMGKSAFAASLACNMALDDKVVLYLSLEMSLIELTDRVIAATGNIPISDLRRGNTLTEQHYEAMVAVFARLSEKKLHFDEQPALTMAQVKAKAREVQRKHGRIDLVVVDYLQMMAGDSRDNRNTQLENISRGLKALAKEANTPVMALSQLSRKVEERTNKRPVNSDLRDSGSLEQDADVIALLYRDEVYNPDTKDRGMAEVNLGKVRNGAPGVCNMAFLGEYTRYDNLAYGSRERGE